MLYSRIEAMCRERGISIAGLEKAVGLGNATIKGWKESSPRFDNLAKVAEYFGCSVDELAKNREDAE
jgi:transcriptional regulator with XRE-family HTH domain